MADGTVATKEEPVTIPRNVKRGYLKETDRLVAWKIHDTMKSMYLDLNDAIMGVKWSAGVTGKSGYAEDFKSRYYDVFERKWNAYQSAYETAYDNPNSEMASQRHSKSVKELMNALNMAMPDYVSKRTDLWFTYVDVGAKPLDAAFWASLAISPFTGESSLVPGFISKGVSLAAKKLTRKVAKGLVEKSVAKNIFRKELMGTLSKVLMYPAAGSIAVEMGKGVSSGAFVEPAVAREAAERSSFLNAIVNLPPNAKERKDIEVALKRSGVPQEIYLPVLEKELKEEGNPNPVSHLNWAMMAIYAVYALPYLPAKVKKPVKEAISKALKRRKITPSTVPMPASGLQW